MGCWGYGTFDSDEAGEWLDENSDRPIRYLRDTLRFGWDLECLCAAEIVSGVLNGIRDRNLHPAVISQIVGLEPRADKVAKLTLSAIDKVREIASEKSELHQRWADGGKAPEEWLANVRDLLNRLQGN